MDLDEDQMCSIIESLLFASDRPLSLASFQKIFKPTSSKKIKKALETIRSSCQSKNRGIFLHEVAGGWQMRTKPENKNFLQQLHRPKDFRLSGASLEVLSIMAYKQPITKSQVDEIRGVESGHLIRTLMEKGLVRFQGKSDLPGKPMLYGTSTLFLEVFSMKNLQELPSLEEMETLLPEGMLLSGEESSLTSTNPSQIAPTVSGDTPNHYSKDQDELQNIEATLKEIDLSCTLFPPGQEAKS